MHTAKSLFAECQKKKHSAKTYFVVCQKIALDKDVFCRVFLFAECIFLALGKHGLCRVPDKIHSAKPRHSANRRFPVVIVVYPHLSIIVHRHRIESSASSFIGILCMATQNSTCSTSSSSEYCKYLGMETRAMHGMKVPFETSRKL